MSERKLFVDPLFPEMGTMNAMFKKLADQMGVSEPADVIKGINDSSWVVSKNEHKWEEEDGVVYFSVVSRGWTIEQWKTYFIVANIGLAANHLFSSANPSEFCYSDIGKIKVAVVRGSIEGSEKMEKLAKQQGFVSPRPEIGCLIRDSFTDDEIRKMGFESIFMMHEPISDVEGVLRRLMINLYYKNIITTSAKFFGSLVAGHTGFAYVVDRSSKGKSGILDYVGDVPVEGADRFVVADHFKVGETDGVKIGHLGDNFKANFSRRIELKVPEVQLRIRSLKKNSRDVEIIEDLGGEKIAETTLAYMWSMLKKQGHGQDGQLLTNGNWNVFYVYDASGVLWVVCARWSSTHQFWCVEALSVSPHEWRAGGQFASL